MTTEARRLANIAAAERYHASPEYEMDLAEEQGFGRNAAGVAAYRKLVAEQDRLEAYRASPDYDREVAARTAHDYAAMRREVGLSDGVAPDAPLCRINGSVHVIIDGKPWNGAFTVRDGRIVKA